MRLWLTTGFMLVGLVCFLSLRPKPIETFDIPGLDKIGHLVAYSVMMLWFGLIYLPGKRHIKLGLAFIALGVVLELLQGMMAYRNFGYLDMCANVFGVIIGGLLARTRVAEALVYLESRMPISNRSR